MASASAVLRKLATGSYAKPRNNELIQQRKGEPPFSENKKGESASLDEMLGAARQAGGGMNGWAIFNVDGIERNRAMIYNELLTMSLDPLVHTCLDALVMAALGGDAEEGKAVFIEYKEPVFHDAGLNDSKVVLTKAQQAAVEIEREKKRNRVQELAADLGPMFNSIAMTVGMNCAIFGDAYGRPYFKKGLGIVSIEVGELVTAPMVEPFERAGITEAYLVQGQSLSDIIKLHNGQFARAKMPRVALMPQVGLISEMAHANLEQDDPYDHSLVPSLVGGSLLAFAEKPFRKLEFLLRLMMTQDVKNSIEENLILLKTKGMDRKQVKTALDNLTKIFQTGWNALKTAFQNGEIPKGNITHVLPVGDQDQISFPETPSIGNNSKNEISMERVFFYARELAGSLGLDLSIAGFADQMAGGLGEGGFFRVSVQQGEKAKSIRQALTPFFNHLIRLHYWYKYGEDIQPSEQFWAVRYWSQISALAAEQQDSENNQMQSGGALINACDQMKQTGLSEGTIFQILSTKFSVNETLASAIAKDLAAGGGDDNANNNGGNGGGGFGE